MQILMGICRLDFINDFLSDQVIAGFTCGSAVHVFSTQIHYLFNCEIDQKVWSLQNESFNIYQVYGEIFNGIASMDGTAWMVLGFSLSVMLVLVIGKEFVNPPVKKRIKIPLPWELMLVGFEYTMYI